MKYNRVKTLLAAFIMGTTLGFAQQINPITQAMLDGYDQTLKSNPKDYFTLYQRAAQYYKLSQYNPAKTDISKAIDYTPAKDKEMLVTEYSLLADINIELKAYDAALQAVEKALELYPDNYALLYKKGNICLYLDKPEDAYRAFSGMQRLKSRSQESYFGMAKALIMQGKNDEEVSGLIKEAEMADPNNYLTYCRVGDLYRDLGENERAATAYISGFSLTNESSRPLQSLIILGHHDYKAVENAIDHALTLTTNHIPLNFLKGNIAYITGNYSSAYEALSALIEKEDGREGSVYAQLARTCLALNKLDEAYDNAALAIVKSPGSANYTLMSEVCRAQGNYASALLNAQKAIKIDPNNTKGIEAAALANIELKQYDDAISQLNEAIMLNADDPMPLALRSYALSKKKDAKSAVADNARIILISSDEFPQVALKALAQTLNGKKMDGDSTMEQALKNDNSKEAWFWAAVYYSQSGSLEKGRQAINRAIELGFDDQYRLKNDKTTNLNISPIRHLLK